MFDDNALIENIDNHNFRVCVTGREYTLQKIKSELYYPTYKVDEIVQYRPRDEKGDPFNWVDAMVTQQVPPALIDNQWCPQYHLSAVIEDLQVTDEKLGTIQTSHIRNKGWRDYLLTSLHKDKKKAITYS